MRVLVLTALTACGALAAGAVAANAESFGEPAGGRIPVDSHRGLPVPAGPPAPLPPPVAPVPQRAAPAPPTALTIPEPNPRVTLPPTTRVSPSPSNASLHDAIIAEMNLLRQNPRSYVAKLMRHRQYFDGTVLRLPGAHPIQTREGVAAVDEAIEALIRTGPLPTLARSEGLSRAAADHARDLSANPRHLGHGGTDGSVPATRAQRYGRWLDVVAENITFGAQRADEVVMDLLVDDGVADRGHRRVMLAPQLRVTGVACAPHADFRLTCVIDYAGGFDERGGEGVTPGATGGYAPPTTDSPRRVPIPPPRRVVPFHSAPSVGVEL